MPKSSQYKHIIWDWNGTLLNDGWLFVDIMNSILRQRKMDTITLEKYRNIFGFPIKDYYIKLGFDLEKESFEESGMEFIKEYWPQLGALMAVIITFVTMKVDISVLKEKVKTLFQIINKDT